MDRKDIAAWKQEQRDLGTADMLFHEQFEIAAKLGIPPDREWTDEEQDRIDDEVNRLYPRRSGRWSWR